MNCTVKYKLMSNQRQTADQRIEDNKTSRSGNCIVVWSAENQSHDASVVMIYKREEGVLTMT